jgi:uncharacterized protein involved in type VI secretion and phage assembly
MRNQYVGVVTGIVTEVDAANASVRLQYPWLEESYRSPAAPIAGFMSGKKHGAYFMPEVDDEVLVAFEQGNFDHPFVVGFLWNGVQTPPETDRQTRELRTPGEHILKFVDKEGSKKIEIKSSGGHVITIDDTANTITVSDSGGGNQVLIEASGTLTVEAASKVVVKAPQIELTEGAAHPLVFGDSLKTYINLMVNTLLKSHMHPGQTCMGIPVTPMTSATLQSLPDYQDSYNSSKVKTG